MTSSGQDTYLSMEYSAQVESIWLFFCTVMFCHHTRSIHYTSGAVLSESSRWFHFRTCSRAGFFVVLSAPAGCVAAAETLPGQF